MAAREPRSRSHGDDIEGDEEDGEKGGEAQHRRPEGRDRRQAGGFQINLNPKAGGNYTVVVRGDLLDTLQRDMRGRGTDVATYVRLQLRALKSGSKVLGLDDRMPFGKYIGERVEDIVRAMPDYVSWLIANKSTRFDVFVVQLLEAMEASL